MRKNYFVLFVTLLFCGCDKLPMNGRLDGRWQLMEVVYHDGSGTDIPKRLYYDISLRVFQLSRPVSETSFPQAILGRFQHTGDSLHIRMIASNRNAVKPFGFNDTIQHFRVMELNAGRMVLNSSYALIKLRKF